MTAAKASAPRTAQGGVTYEYLTEEERLRLVENQLLSLEREYFMLTELGAEGAESQEERVSYLETEIARLRGLRDSVSPATPAS